MPFFKDCIQQLPPLSAALPLSADLPEISCSPTGRLAIESFVPRNNDFSFVCSNCLTFRVANTSHLVNFDSSASVLAYDQ